MDGVLDVSLINGFNLGANNRFGLIDEDGGSITGTFANLPEGATVFTDNGYDLKITYQGLINGSSIATRIAITATRLPTKPSQITWRARRNPYTSVMMSPMM